MSEISSRESNSVIDSRPGVPNAKARAFHAGLLLFGDLERSNSSTVNTREQLGN